MAPDGWGGRPTAPAAPLRPYLVVAAVVASASIAGFAVVQALDLPVLGDPATVLAGRGAMVAAALGTGLLVADVVAPVPSSLVMVGHGALFGPAAGAALSLVGRVGATAAGAALGRAGRRWLAPDGARRHRAEVMVRRWGPGAVVVSRPVPVLAETVAVVAGAAGMPWPRLVAAAAVGALPEAVLYALAGSVAASFGSAALVVVAVVGVAMVTALVTTRRDARRGCGS